MRKQQRLSPEHETCAWVLTCSLTVKAVFQQYRSMYRWFWTPWIALWDCAGLQVHAGSSEQWGHFPPPGCLGCEEGAVLALTGQQGSSSSAQQQVMSTSHLVKSSTVACGSFYKSHFNLLCRFQGAIQEHCPQGGSLARSRLISTHVGNLVSRPCCTEKRQQWWQVNGIIICRPSVWTSFKFPVWTLN